MSTVLPQAAVSVSTPIHVGPCGISPAELDAIVKAAGDLFGTPVVAILEDDPEIDERYYVLRMK